MQGEVDVRELARRVEALERRFDSVADSARKRQDGFGSVKAKADRVPDLQEQVRDLTHQVQRLSGRPLSEQVPVAAEPSKAMPLSFDLKKVIEAVLAQLRGQGQYLPTKDEVLQIVKTEVANAVTKLDLTELAQRVYRDLTTAGVEEKVAKLLGPTVAKDVNIQAIVSAVVQNVLGQLDMKALAEKVATAIAGNLEVSVSKRRF